MADQEKLNQFASVLAADLKATERAIDDSLAKAGMMLTNMASGRIEAGLAAQTGHAAMTKVGEAINAGINYRGTMVDLHRTLEVHGRKMKADWSMGGPFESKPEDGSKHKRLQREEA
mgnify:CR=1 FL=1